MEQDFEKSIHILEDALSHQGQSLLQISTPKTAARPKFAPDNLTLFTQDNFNRSYSISESIGTELPWKNAVDNCFMEFYEILQSHTNEHGVFDVVADMERCCTNLLNVIQSLRTETAFKTCPDEVWIEKERNTWRLLFALCQDRLGQNAVKNEEETKQSFGLSEKNCVTYFFKTVALLRESQLVIDWLESVAAEKDNEIVHFSDSSVGWENTFHQLKSLKTIVYESSSKLVTQLHPDAPHVEDRNLHDLDMEDEERLCRRMFTEIRCGKFEKAQKLAAQCGHSWRAAMLEGWKLFHDPNSKTQKAAMDTDVPNDERTRNAPWEGNPNRDLWKAMALDFCMEPYLNVYEKAAIGACCGDLRALLSVCSTWEDVLWAYMRVLVDIRVESEIRDNIIREYMALPDSYWQQRMSINDVFQRIETMHNADILKAAKDPHHLAQKLLILDETTQLIEHVANWAELPDVSTQFLRFATHLVLFFDQLGQVENREAALKPIEAYVMRLTEMKETQLVAFYVSKLGIERQIDIYSRYLENITDNEERKEALCFADASGLQTQTITKRVVENTRKLPHEVTVLGNLQKEMTDTDLKKISAIDWLLIYDAQKVEALKQSNAIIFAFLTLQKLDAAHLAFNKIPVDTIDKIVSEGEVLPATDKIIKEHLSYKAYLDAHEAFAQWYKQFSAKPAAPAPPPENAAFAVKVAHQHKVSQFNAETEIWRLSAGHLAKTAKGALYNVLLFPHGWLNGAKDAHYLQSICIPECTFLLYRVLFETGAHVENVQLADLLASERHCLYKTFAKEKLGELLTKLCESSVALLNDKKDAWGQEL